MCIDRILWTASTMSDGAMFDVAEDSPVNFIVAFLFLVAIAYGIASYLNHTYFFYRRDRLLVLWFTFVIVNTVALHIPYVVVSLLFGPIESSRNVFVFVVKDYGRADARWLRNDPTILTAEIFVVTVELYLSFLVVRGIILDNLYRHFCQLFLCTCQVCRIWFVFGPQIFGGFADLNSANPFHFLIRHGSITISATPYASQCQRSFSTSPTWICRPVSCASSNHIACGVLFGRQVAT